MEGTSQLALKNCINVQFLLWGGKKHSYLKKKFTMVSIKT